MKHSNPSLIHVVQILPAHFQARHQQTSNAAFLSTFTWVQVCLCSPAQQGPSPTGWMSLPSYMDMQIHIWGSRWGMMRTSDSVSEALEDSAPTDGWVGRTGRQDVAPKRLWQVPPQGTSATAIALSSASSWPRVLALLGHFLATPHPTRLTGTGNSINTAF